MRHPRRFRNAKSVLFLALSAGLVVAASWSAFSASAETAHDLRGDIPTGEEVRDELDALAESRDSLLGSLTAAEADLAEVFTERESLGAAQRALTAEIEAAIESLRRVAVQTFVTGGSVSSIQFLAGVGEASDLSWRQHLVRNHAGSSQLAVERLQDLRERAGDDVTATIDRATQIRAEMSALEFALIELKPRETELRDLLPLAAAWDRAAIAIAKGPYGVASADKWAALRRCESTNNYAAVSPSGVYRGAYQFDLPTWYTVGGVGDPALAPPEEQDARARELYARRGHEPWPVCGSHLE